ncbi:hypothetical protein KUW09_04880 [Mameliella alba]|nr:hypothetical protein [Antarctobacter heliothermus]MBY6143363.1 hypothetical protein [Mameliella alba]MBY6163964.1 hypothetical protein [Mameliella alba]MBY6172436.1 hypothetical protein [Mameliella alba]MBY6177450.1 hypothetical protein [Mameliella alba]
MRKPTWRADLAAYLAGIAGVAYRPGRHDCALFVAGAVKVMTGTDHARGWRSKYRSIKRGQVMLRDRGFDGHVGFVAAHYPEVAPILAQAGDIAVIDGDNLGVVQGAGVYVLRPDGLGIVPLTAAERAFRV